jgi:hypothetical protein
MKRFCVFPLVETKMGERSQDSWHLTLQFPERHQNSGSLSPIQAHPYYGLVPRTIRKGWTEWGATARILSLGPFIFREGLAAAL